MLSSFSQSPVCLQCEKDPRLKKFPIDRLVIRAALSPTALVYSVSSSDDEHGHLNSQQDADTWLGLEEKVVGVVQPVAVEVAAIWADVLKNRSVPVLEKDREVMAQRDAVIRINGTESVLGGALAMAFGEEKSSEILDAYRNP